jgi:hypothetical protein
VAEDKDQEHVRAPRPDEPQYRWFREVGGTIVEAVRIEVLPGLPTHGSPALRFSAVSELNVGSEGYVVRFSNADGRVWTGNFRRGESGDSSVHCHPDGQHAVVVSSGQAYLISPMTSELTAVLGDSVRFVVPCASAQALALCGDIFLTVLYADGSSWQAGRISWDGTANVRVEGTILRGDTYDPLNRSGVEWVPFEADLVERRVTGGSWS